MQTLKICQKHLRTIPCQNAGCCLCQPVPMAVSKHGVNNILSSIDFRLLKNNCTYKIIACSIWEHQYWLFGINGFSLFPGLPDGESNSINAFRI